MPLGHSPVPLIYSSRQNAPLPATATTRSPLPWQRKLLSAQISHLFHFVSNDAKSQTMGRSSFPQKSSLHIVATATPRSYKQIFPMKIPNEPSLVGFRHISLRPPLPGMEAGRCAGKWRRCTLCILCTRRVGGPTDSAIPPNLPRW